MAEYPTTSEMSVNGYKAHEGSNAAENVSTPRYGHIRGIEEGMNNRPSPNNSGDETFRRTTTRVRHWEGK